MKQKQYANLDRHGDSNSVWRRSSQQFSNPTNKVFVNYFLNTWYTSTTKYVACIEEKELLYKIVYTSVTAIRHYGKIQGGLQLLRYW